jgi:hypothetical protein
LPSQTDHSDPASSEHPKTLPALEVNPLVNPLLAENMGRWAEVYFKSPPENREQAVRELLQQLEAENAQRGNDPSTPQWTNEQGFTHDEGSRSEAFVPSLENRAPQTGHSFTDSKQIFTEQSIGRSGAEPSLPEHRFVERTLAEQGLAKHALTEQILTEHGLFEESLAKDPFEDHVEKNHSAASQLATIHCRSCGHENRDDQRFCGMCGLPLQRDAATEPAAKAIETDARMDREFHLRQPEEFERERPSPPGLWSARRKNADDSVSDGLIRSLDYDTGTRSSGVYIGAVIVVVVLALGYVGWRSSRATGYSSYATQAAPTAAGQATKQPPPAIPPKVDAVDQSANAQATDADGTSESKPVTKPNNVERPNSERLNVERVSAAGNVAKPPIASVSVTSAPATSESQTPLIGGSGYEELAMAKRYLNGSAGQQNSAEAVDWLWKAVAKRNTDATLLLSEMFMRGNGIPKNCDQARVLLDAAASRGVKDAAVRLRNMQAFGCP